MDSRMQRGVRAGDTVIGDEQEIYRVPWKSVELCTGSGWSYTSAYFFRPVRSTGSHLQPQILST
jgi:hypothetical protein